VRDRNAIVGFAVARGTNLAMQYYVTMDNLKELLLAIRAGPGVSGLSKRIFLSYKKAIAATSNDNKKGSTDEPWKLPGRFSQQPKQKGPPKRKREYKHNETA